MLTAARARLRKLDRDAGVTLVELLVAMGLSTILAAITLGMFVVVNNSAASTTDRTVATAQARTALQAWSGYLRVADGPNAAGNAQDRIEWATAHDMLFYASIGNRSGSTAPNPPTMIWLRLFGDQLVEEQFAAPAGSTYPATYPTTWTTCRVVADKVSGLTLTPYTASAADTNFGTAPAPSTTVCAQRPTVVAQPLAMPTLAKVTAVGIDIMISGTASAQSHEFSTQVTLPTLGGS